MKVDVFCPKCDAYVTNVNPDSNGYKVIVKSCPMCSKHFRITYGNGRIEIEQYYRGLEVVLMAEILYGPEDGDIDSELWEKGYEMDADEWFYILRG